MRLHPARRSRLSTVLHAAPTMLGMFMLLVTVAVIGGQLFGFRMVAINTGSMTGTADAGSLVIARLEPTDGLQVGDVITYLPPPDSGIDHAVTHRIAEIGTAEDGATTYRTKGDANQSIDFWSFRLDDPTQLVMQAAVPMAGRPVLLLADPTLRTIVIGVPAAAIALLALLDLVRVWREDDDVLIVLPDAVRPAPTHAGSTMSSDASFDAPVAAVDAPAAPTPFVNLDRFTSGPHKASARLRRRTSSKKR